MGTEEVGKYLFITPALFLGSLSPPFQHETVSTSEEAIEIIESGGTVLLPPGAWDEAAAVLRHFGASDADIRRQIHFARTGKIFF